MAIHHRYALLGQVDERPPKPMSADQLWKLASQKNSAPMLLACTVLIGFIILTMFSNEPTINLSADVRAAERPVSISQMSPKRRQVSVSPVIQEIAPPRPPPNVTALIDFSVGGCNIWRGDWIPHPHEPPYTNATCSFIQENQNCIKLGRPDLAFLQWRWKPHDCVLPLFDAKAFLTIVAGKKLGFIGDSLARNSYQSVLCQLAQVEVPERTYHDSWDGNVVWYFKSYDFTLAVAWTPFFVKGYEQTEEFGKGMAKVHLDVIDDSWGPLLHNFDYIVLSGGRWYVRPAVYFVKNKLMGCCYCSMSNTTDVGYPYAYSAALRTVFDFLISSNYKGVVLFRTFSPEHWENGAWDQGGECKRKAPYKSKSTPLDDMSYNMYKSQLEEFAKTVQRSSEYSFKFKIVDTLHSAVLRPDAHPGPYGHFHPRVKNDCVHWCLPGVVDTWSDMILHVLKHL